MVLTVLMVPVLMGAFLLLMERFEARLLGVAPPWTYPSSFGGLIGATLAAARPGAVHVTAVLGKVVLPALVSPLLAGWWLPTAATVGALASSIAITGTVGVWAVALGGVLSTPGRTRGHYG